MTLEDLIYKRLTEDNNIAEKLAKHQEYPAVFYQTAPGDKDDGWNKKRQYPRIDYTVDLKSNPEHQTAGTMQLNIWCNEKDITPEELEPIIRECLCNVFIQPSQGAPYCLSWARSDAFDMPKSDQTSTKIIGITMMFDLLAFPLQVTSDPDPILTLYQFIKSWCHSVMAIGMDSIDSFYTPQKCAPAFYFRIDKLAKESESNTVIWMIGSIAAHIFAPDAADRLQWAKALGDSLAILGEITMPDSSPMFIKSLQVDGIADYMTIGQIKIGIKYGILRRKQYAHPLMEANFNEKE